MSKNLWLIYVATVIVLISVSLITLLIILPQENTTQGIAGKKYERINKQEYRYTPSKGITEEALVEEYKISTEAIREGQADKNYKPGNTDPFTSPSKNPVTTGVTGKNGITGTNEAVGTTGTNGKTETIDRTESNSK